MDEDEKQELEETPEEESVEEEQKEESTEDDLEESQEKAELEESEEAEDEPEEAEWSDFVQNVLDDEVPEAWLKSPEDALRSGKEMLAEMKRGQTDSSRLKKADEILRSAGIAGGIDDVLNFQPPHGPIQPAAQPTQMPSTYRQAIDNAIRTGFLPQDTVERYAEILPLFEVMHGVTSYGIGQVRDIAQTGLKETQTMTADDRAWDRFMMNNKKFTEDDRAKLKPVKRQHNLSSYEEAALLLKSRDPDGFAAAFNRAEKKGKNKVLRLKGFKKGSKTSKKQMGSYIGKDGLDQDRLLADYSAGKITEEQVNKEIAKSVA
jgi:hypothetical protein